MGCRSEIHLVSKRRDWPCLARTGHYHVRSSLFCGLIVVCWLGLSLRVFVSVVSVVSRLLCPLLPFFVGGRCHVLVRMAMGGIEARGPSKNPPKLTRKAEKVIKTKTIIQKQETALWRRDEARRSERRVKGQGEKGNHYGTCIR